MPACVNESENGMGPPAVRGVTGDGYCRPETGVLRRGTSLRHFVTASPSYSAFMPRSLMTLPHFLYSLWTWAENSAGELATTTRPRSSKRFTWSGAVIVFFSRSLSRETIAGGVAFGAHSPCQVLNS